MEKGGAGGGGRGGVTACHQCPCVLVRLCNEARLWPGHKTDCRGGGSADTFLSKVQFPDSDTSTKTCPGPATQSLRFMGPSRGNLSCPV